MVCECRMGMPHLSHIMSIVTNKEMNNLRLNECHQAVGKWIIDDHGVWAAPKKLVLICLSVFWWKRVLVQWGFICAINRWVDLCTFTWLQQDKPTIFLKIVVRLKLSLLVDGDANELHCLKNLVLLSETWEIRSQTLNVRI